MQRYSHDMLTNLQSLEFSLLNFLLLEPSENILLLSENDFYYIESKQVYKRLLDKYQNQEEINPVEFYDEMAVRDKIIATILVFDPHYPIKKETFHFYLSHFQNMIQKNQAYGVVVNAASSIEKGKDKDDVLASLSEEIISLTSGIKKEGQTDIELYREFFDLERPKSNLHMAYSGLKALDYNLRNLVGGRLVVIAARPGQGKSALAIQIMVNAIVKQKKVGYISLEMGKNEIVSRMMANHYEHDVSELQRGNRATLMSLMNDYSAKPLPANGLFLTDSLFKLSGINRKIREWKNEGVSLVIVDHIGLIDSESDSNRNEQLGRISRLLKQLTQQLQIPIIALSQLNRASENEKRKPQLSDLRDSGNIEQDADAVLMFYHDKVGNDGIKYLDIGILKNRAGVTDWLGPRFAFNGSLQQFSEIMLNVQVR
jgi:replicative DNA helicase